ncbi:hypothetical protein D3C87_2055530 [compost metagenome]
MIKSVSPCLSFLLSVSLSSVSLPFTGIVSSVFSIEDCNSPELFTLIGVFIDGSAAKVPRIANTAMRYISLVDLLICDR